MRTHKHPLREQKKSAVWFLYMIRTANQTLYTGITIDIQRRFAAHQANKGAKHLMGKGPLHLVYQVAIGDQSTALRLEYRIKQLTKIKKEQLVQDQPTVSQLLAWLLP